MENSQDYYVYVYIDPRNFEEFYYGKGKGNRKEAHLFDDKDTAKSKRIGEIKKAGLLPIIKVIARNLTEKEAFLVEKTLIWKLGRTLTNISSGQFADKFRPHNTFHLDLQGFDFQNGIYYVNVGEGKHRCWEDCKLYGFLAAGQAKKYSDSIKSLEVGDIVVAYLKTKGYVGIGKVQEKAVKVDNFYFQNKLLTEYPLKQLNIFENSDNENSEYLVKVKWIESVEKDKAKWISKKGLFTSRQVKVSLQGQLETIKFLEKEFLVGFRELMLE